jgi:hypothetical protein
MRRFTEDESGYLDRLGGERDEPEALACEGLGHDPRCCRRCLHESVPDRECETPQDPGQAKRPDTAPEAPEAEADSEELVLTGAEATAAWRPYRTWFLVWFALAAATILGGWLLWHRSAMQLTFLGIGVFALFVAAQIWHFGVIGFEYSKSGADVTFTRRFSPVRREIATPVLAVAGICLILAAAFTTISAGLSPVVTAGTVVLDFGQATWSILLTIFFLGAAIAGLFSREDREGSGCLLALMIAVALVNYLLIRFTGWGRQEWDSFVQPFSDMWHLLGR